MPEPSSTSARRVRDLQDTAALPAAVVSESKRASCWTRCAVACTVKVARPSPGATRRSCGHADEASIIGPPAHHAARVRPSRTRSRSTRSTRTPCCRSATSPLRAPGALAAAEAGGCRVRACSPRSRCPTRSPYWIGKATDYLRDMKDGCSSRSFRR
ncbi:hypothetical protein HBB16_16445 [Pseudonocardia sp. MCCB 268]|nr:hypothetical protein [Pseudonocardia cytotoxica]